MLLNSWDTAEAEITERMIALETALSRQIA
jgi:hypothetical protein